MSAEWNQQRLEQFINDQVEEGQSLEYKAAEALNKSDKSKQEITKDVSAMANSAGGIIIYGISESSVSNKRHIPEKISPIVRPDFSKEWLEQIINNIKPRIDGVRIHPVSLNSGNEHVAYVVEIPQSTTAHQAADHRYHKRYNFEVQSMLDHEIRDVMGRRQNPRISLKFFGEPIVVTLYANSLEILDPEHRPETKNFFDLKIHAHNEGGVYANYVCCFVLIPKAVLAVENTKDIKIITEDNIEHGSFTFENTTRDFIGFSSGREQLGPVRHEPILPSLSGFLGNIRLCSLEEIDEFKELFIRWIAHADNAPPIYGEIRLEEFLVADRQDTNDMETR
jgi:hypothetical protein